MGAENELLLICATPHPKVRVVRFVKPDMRSHLDSSEAVAQSVLFQELRAAALEHLAPGETVVLNLGLIDWFPTAFFRLLLRANEEVRAAGAQLLVCCLPALAKEAFELMGGDRTFAGQVCETEARAVYTASHPPA